MAYTGYTQNNGTDSKVNKKFISHLTRAQRTPTAGTTVQVSHALITILQNVHPRSQDTHTYTHTHTHTHTKPFPAVTPSWKLAPRPRSKHEKRTAGSAWETWTVATADGVRCARVRWEINFLLTFESAPFVCVHPVYYVSVNLLCVLCDSENVWKYLLGSNFILEFFT